MGSCNCVIKQEAELPNDQLDLENQGKHIYTFPLFHKVFVNCVVTKC